MLVDREARAVASTATTRATVLAVTGSVYVLVSRTLGPSGVGAFSVLVTIATVAVILGHLSVEQAQTYLWSTGVDRRALGANAKVLGIMAGVVAGAAGWAAVRLLGPTVLPIGNSWLVGVAAGTVPATVTVLYLANVLMLADRVQRVNLALGTAAVIELVAVLLLVAYRGLTVTTAILVWAGSEVVPLFLLVPSVPGSWADRSARLARRTVSLGARYHVAMVFLFLLWRVDILIVNALASSAEVGRYAVAVAIAEVTYVVTDAIAQVMLPRQTASSMEESARVTARLVRVSAMVGAGAVAAITGSSMVLVPLVLGRPFTGVLPPLAVLAPGVVALATVRAVGGYLIRLDRPMILATLCGTAMAANVALNLILVPVIGIVGSALASSIAYLGLGAGYLTWMATSSGIPWQAFVPRPADLSAMYRRIRPPSDVPTTTATTVVSHRPAAPGVRLRIGRRRRRHDLADSSQLVPGTQRAATTQSQI